MTALLRKLALLLRRDRFRSELEEEMAFHRTQAEESFLADGMSGETARRAAKRQFGNEARLREQSHEAIGFRLESVWQDVRYAVRQMLRSPGFTLAVVVTLALGMGANTAIFSVVEATLLRPLPYPDAGRIVSIRDQRIQGVSTGGLITVPRFFDLQARSRAFASVACFYFQRPTLVVGTRLPQQVDAVSASSDFWRVLGERALIGRTFDAVDDRQGAAEVAVISYAAWQRYFGGDAGVIGKTVEIDRKPVIVIGVMPAEFHYPSLSDAGVDIWVPTRFNPENWKSYRGEGVRFVLIVARVKEGVALASATGELQTINAQLAREHPDTDGPWRLRGEGLVDEFYGELRPALGVLLAASATLLLIACLNVANLLLSRAKARAHEVAVRRALGASRGRLVRQWITESTLLALLGGGIGLGSAFVLLRLAANSLPASLALGNNLEVNWQVAGFALATSLVAGVLFGMAPAMERDLSSSMGEGGRRLNGESARTTGRRSGRVRSAFIAAQVGLSLMLLVVSCLLAESLWKLTRSPLGFAPDHVIAFKIELPWQTNATATDRFFEDVQRRLESLPGVIAVGQINALPTEDWHARGTFDVDWKPRTERKDAVSAELRNMAGNYLGAMGIPLQAGRPLKGGDSNAVLVNAEFVRRYLPGGNPIGRHMVGGSDVQIVGVIGNVRGTSGTIAVGVEPEVYYPASGEVVRSFALRSAVDPEALTAAIRAQVRQVDSQQAVGTVRTLAAMVGADTAQARLNMALVASFAAIALALACVGIYGVVAYSVAQRRQEIGVRMALGASRGQISGLFLRQTLASALIGMGCGGVATLLLTRLLRSQLYGVEPNDPKTFLIALLLLLIPVFAASLRPALKAASLDPVEALRTE